MSIKRQLEMKTMTKTFLILGLLACILSISSADDSSDGTTDEATQPGGTVSNSASSGVPSTKDIAKAADPSFAASALETPVRWLLDSLYYVWSYLIYTPLSTAASFAIQSIILPITLPLKTITVPINLLFGSYLAPIKNYFSEQYQSLKNFIWWLVLESISYGSGATAEAVSDAMQVAIRGVLQFSTDIGLPIANSAEKLAQVTDQLAKTRRKRGIESIFGKLRGGASNIIRFPFRIMSAMFSVFTYPFRAVFGLVTYPFTLLFGSSDEENSTYTLLLTDMSTQRITNMVLESIWDFMKKTGFPEMDLIAQKLMKNNMVPSKLREILAEYDSVYRVVKMLGYVN